MQQVATQNISSIIPVVDTKRSDQGQTVAIDRSTAELLDEWCNANKAVKKAILSGIVGWWARQTPVVMRGIALGKVDPEFAEQYARELERLAENLRRKVAAGEAVFGRLSGIFSLDAPTTDRPQSQQGGKPGDEDEGDAAGAPLPINPKKPKPLNDSRAAAKDEFEHLKQKRPGKRDKPKGEGTK